MVYEHADHCAVLRSHSDHYGAQRFLHPFPHAVQGQKADYERRFGAGHVPGLSDDDCSVLSAQDDGTDSGGRGSRFNSDFLRVLRYGLLHFQGLLRHHSEVSG